VFETILFCFYDSLTRCSILTGFIYAFYCTYKILQYVPVYLQDSLTPSVVLVGLFNTFCSTYMIVYYILFYV